MSGQVKRYKAKDEFYSDDDSESLISKPNEKYENTGVPKRETKGMTSGKIEIMAMERGQIGKIIGIGDNALKNIVFIILVLLILIYVALLLFKSEHVNNYWANASNIITLSLGYIFGKNNSK